MINDWIVAIAFLIVILVLVIIAIIIGFKTPSYQPTRRERYENYIHSSKWRRRRARALMLGNYQCAKCGARNKLQVHHLSYQHLGNELDCELMVLCHSCHQRVHGRKF